MIGVPWRGARTGMQTALVRNKERVTRAGSMMMVEMNVGRYWARRGWAKGVKSKG